MVPGKGDLGAIRAVGVREWGWGCKLLAVARESQLRRGSTNAVYSEVQLFGKWVLLLETSPYSGHRTSLPQYAVLLKHGTLLH